MLNTQSMIFPEKKCFTVLTRQTTIHLNSHTQACTHACANTHTESYFWRRLFPPVCLQLYLFIMKVTGTWFKKYQVLLNTDKRKYKTHSFLSSNSLPTTSSQKEPPLTSLSFVPFLSFQKQTIIYLSSIYIHFKRHKSNSFFIFSTR